MWRAGWQHPLRVRSPDFWGIVVQGTRKTPGRSTRRPGRPAAGKDIWGLILDVGEQLFAANGYSGTSIRDIATHAGVNQALIGYHFGSKTGLFEAVFKRRGLAIVQRRADLLDALEARRARPPTVRELVEAYLVPQFDMKRSGPAGLAFCRLQARLHNEPEELAFRLRRDVYDISTKRYIAALERSLPHVDPADISFRMMFLIGTYLYMLADVDRLDELSDNRFDAKNLDELVTRMVDFMVGGLDAPSTFNRKPGKPAPGRRRK
jgi:AcrR family transcriptional regulator